MLLKPRVKQIVIKSRLMEYPCNNSIVTSSSIRAKSKTPLPCISEADGKFSEKSEINFFHNNDSVYGYSKYLAENLFDTYIKL